MTARQHYDDYAANWDRIAGDPNVQVQPASEPVQGVDSQACNIRMCDGRQLRPWSVDF